MTRKEAYDIIAKHIYTAHKKYISEHDDIIILADTMENAKEKARQYFKTDFIIVSRLITTKENSVYKI